jgi:D-alanine-D-alanine ligase
VKKLRILVLVHSTLVPPITLEGATEKEIGEWRTEFDVITQLRSAGHEVRPIGISDSLSELRRAIMDWNPTLPSTCSRNSTAS